MTRRLAALGIAALSLVLIVSGIALVYVPAALIASGIGLGSFLFVDFDRSQRR